jgi:hypothetical protein
MIRVRRAGKVWMGGDDRRRLRSGRRDVERVDDGPCDDAREGPRSGVLAVGSAGDSMLIGSSYSSRQSLSVYHG